MYKAKPRKKINPTIHVNIYSMNSQLHSWKTWVKLSEKIHETIDSFLRVSQSSSKSTNLDA